MAGLIMNSGISGKAVWEFLRHTPAAGSTFAKGMILTCDGNGRLQAPVAAGNNLGGGLLLAGLANEAATGLQGSTAATLKTVVSFMLANPEGRFLMPLYHATPASAVFTPGNAGNAYELRVDAGGALVGDISQNTNTYVRLEGVLAQDYPGWPAYNGVGNVLYPLCEWSFIGSHCLFGGYR